MDFDVFDWIVGFIGDVVGDFDDFVLGVGVFFFEELSFG